MNISFSNYGSIIFLVGLPPHSVLVSYATLDRMEKQCCSFITDGEELKNNLSFLRRSTQCSIVFPSHQGQVPSGWLALPLAQNLGTAVVSEFLPVQQPGIKYNVVCRNSFNPQNLFQFLEFGTGSQLEGRLPIMFAPLRTVDMTH